MNPSPRLYAEDPPLCNYTVTRTCAVTLLLHIDVVILSAHQRSDSLWAPHNDTLCASTQQHSSTPALGPGCKIAPLNWLSGVVRCQPLGSSAPWSISPRGCRFQIYCSAAITVCLETPGGSSDMGTCTRGLTLSHPRYSNLGYATRPRYRTSSVGWRTGIPKELPGFVSASKNSPVRPTVLERGY